MTGPIIEIDIGSHGAIARLTPTGDLDGVVDMPLLRDGRKGRPNVSAALLMDIIFNMKAVTAYVEFVGARPGEGAVGAFAFGRSGGVIEGVHAARLAQVRNDGRAEACLIAVAGSYGQGAPMSEVAFGAAQRTSPWSRRRRAASFMIRRSEAACHRTDARWTLGSYPAERFAVRAVLDSSRRR